MSVTHTHCTSFTIIHSISSWIISIKQPRLFCTRCKLVPAQRLSLLSPLRFTFVPTSSSQQISVFPLLQQINIQNSPFSILCPCATFHSPPHPSICAVCPYYFFTRASAESRRCDGVGMLIDFSQIRPQSLPSLAQMPSESWLCCSTAVSTMGGCKSVQTSGCLAASLQKHVQGVHHAFTQVCGAARRQQGAEFEGFGDAVLVDVCQHVLIPLAAQDDLGVVVVKVDLRRKERFIY